MASTKSHKDVEFHVESNGRPVSIFKSFDAAAAEAVMLSLTGRSADIDVVVWSASGARWYGGEDAVSLYNDDPEASVFERIVVKANSQGRVP